MLGSANDGSFAVGKFVEHSCTEPETVIDSFPTIF